MDNDDLNQNRDVENLGDLTDDSQSAEDSQEAGRGNAQEEEATKRYTLDLPKSLHKWLKKQAVIEERSMKVMTIEALRQYRQDRE